MTPLSHFFTATRICLFQLDEIGVQSTIIGNTSMSAEGEGWIEVPVLFLPLTNHCSVHIIRRTGILEIESSRNCILTTDDLWPVAGECRSFPLASVAATYWASVSTPFLVIFSYGITPRYELRNLRNWCGSVRQLNTSRLYDCKGKDN
jgi:hypothetical protein